MTPIHNGQRFVQWARDNTRVVGCGQGITDAGVLTTHARVKPTNAGVLITHARVSAVLGNRYRRPRSTPLCRSSTLFCRAAAACGSLERASVARSPFPPSADALPQSMLSMLFLNRRLALSSCASLSLVRALSLALPGQGSFWELAWRRQLGARRRHTSRCPTYWVTEEALPLPRAPLLLSLPTAYTKGQVVCLTPDELVPQIRKAVEEHYPSHSGLSPTPRAQQPSGALVARVAAPAGRAQPTRDSRHCLRPRLLATDETQGDDACMHLACCLFVARLHAVCWLLGPVFRLNPKP
jgi:hypothetical protein